MLFEPCQRPAQVEVGSCNSFAAAVSVPACATATNVRTSLRSRSFISSSFFSHTTPLRSPAGTAMPFISVEPTTVLQWCNSVLRQWVYERGVVKHIFIAGSRRAMEQIDRQTKENVAR